VINGRNYVYATKALTNSTVWYQPDGSKRGGYRSFTDASLSPHYQSLGQSNFSAWGGDYGQSALNTIIPFYGGRKNVLGRYVGQYEYGFRGLYDNITQALFFNEQTTKIATALIFTQSGNPRDYKSFGTPFEYTPVLAASNYCEYDDINAAAQSIWAQDFKYSTSFIDGTDQYKYQWFDPYPGNKNSKELSPGYFNYLDYNYEKDLYRYNYSRILADTTWDCMVGSWVEAPNVNPEVKGNMSIPNTVLFTRSFTHQTNQDADTILYNQAIVLKWSGEVTEMGPIWNVVGNFKEKINNTDEKYRWARRNYRDNTNRILHDVSGSGDNFYLPSGHKIESNSLVENGNASISTVVSEPVDKWLKLPNYGKCYIDVSKGILQSIDVDKSVNFDNSLTANTKYNYIYVTRDSASNDNVLYAMMAYVDTGNTLTGNARKLLSRLMYINLEE